MPHLRIREIMHELGQKGMTVDQCILVTELIAICLGSTGKPQPKSDAERAREYRARRHENHVTRDDVTVKEAPHTPQENIYIYNKPKNEKRGTRLPSDWKPSPESLSYAQKLGFSATEIEAAAEDMRLWAASASGQVAIKRDWESAFKGWMRREKAKKPTARANYGKVIQGSFRPKAVEPEKVKVISEEERQANLEKLAKLKFQPKGI